LRGYLLRLADTNGIAGLRSLFDLIDETVPEKELEAVAAFLGRPARDIEPLAGVVPKADGSYGGLQRSHGLPMRFWNMRYARLCPKCLEESSIWQSSWELVLVVACPKHKVRLIDQCPTCHREIRWHRKYFTECDCGQVLVEITPTPCSDFEAWISARQGHCLLGSKKITKSGHGDVLNHLELNDFISLLWFMGGYASGKASKPLKIEGIYRMEVALQLIRAAGDIFTSWPIHFHRFLFELGGFASTSHQESRLMKRFGFFYHSLYSNFQGEQFEFLHKAFEAFLRENWPGALARRNRRLSDELILEHRMLPLTKVAKALRVSRKTVRQMIAHEQLSATTNTLPSGRTVISIDRESLLSLQAKQADWISFTQARNLLGLSKKRFRCLLETGMVQALSGPKIDGAVVWRFSKTKIEGMKKLEGSVMLTDG
jgi:hypothetical protein